MKNISNLYFIIAISYFSLWADTLVIHNMTSYDLYAALYYVKGDSIEKANKDQEVEDTRIPSGSATFISRPARKIFYDRYLIVATTSAKLTPVLTLKQFHESVHAEAGDTKGFEFFVIEESSKLLRIYNNLEWKLKPFMESVGQLPDKFWQLPLFSEISGALKEVYERYLKNPFTGRQVTVRRSSDISSEEKAYISKRFTKTKGACEIVFQRSLTDQQTPRIALCMSGGGYRAMITALGFLIGLQGAGLLDCTLYMAGLSGSTWLMAPWLESKKSINGYRDILIPKLTHGLLSGNIDAGEIKRALLRKLVFNQPLSLVDIYGALLAQKLLVGFGKDPQDMYVYQQAEHIKEGNYPYPIYTAVIPIQQYEWFEFTPHEAGSLYLQSFVPSWAFGRYFDQGKSVTNAEPPMSLGFLMGICGSAFSANLREFLENYEDKLITQPQLRELLYFAIANPTVGTSRISAASVYNLSFNIPQVHLNTFKKITLVDAGVEFNVPLPPLLRPERAVDVVIICDASKSLQGAPALRKAHEYAVNNNIPFPPISYEGIENKICSIFHDPTNPKTPVIIYMPMVHNPTYGTYNPAQFMQSYLETLNFVYTGEQVFALSGLMAHNVLEAAPAIKEVLEKVIERKTPKS